MNVTKIRWLLPNDKYFENRVCNLAEFIPLLKTMNVVTFGALSYKVTHIELILDEEMWISVVLE
jgi:hypothetical protein